ncbi:MAG TPA: phenylalanine--tRNA ligase subunit alpha [Alphaproteobacteria bacterium]|nr:phenylalanine--tRNA ligase subunit alpha [Alphaproteobacteria bacterium]
MSDMETLQADLLAQVESAADLAQLDAVRVAVLGKKGLITEKMKTLGAMSPDERKAAGQQFNTLKTAVADAIEAKKSKLEEDAINARLAREAVDITLPVRPETQGRVHPLYQTYDEVVAIFGQMGFDVAEGPDIEDDFHNFTALNTPKNHPARQMQDTFYLKGEENGDKFIVRTQTSAVQIRTMEKQKPPVRVIVPGRTYRCDYDATHAPMFHQVEGLIVDTETNMAHLKGCLIEFVKTFFELDKVPVRFRPSFFPFTEPSAEMDIGCSRKNGELKIGEGDDWLEILGCGMVHPNVLKACNIDPEIYQGFAFGIGLDRLAMLKYAIPDLRTFFESDLRWIKHYGFVPLDIPSTASGLSMTGGNKR